nr:hypothetical protein GCM10020093_006320 [Planobispora longispora]
MFLASALAFAVAAAAVRAVMLPDPAREITGSFLSAYRAVPALLGRPALLLRYAATVTVLASFVAVYTGLQVTGAAGTGSAAGAAGGGLPSMILVPLLTPWLVKIPALPRAAGALILCALTLVAVGVTTPGATGLALLLAVYVAGISAGGPALNESVARLAGSRAVRPWPCSPSPSSWAAASARRSPPSSATSVPCCTASPHCSRWAPPESSPRPGADRDRGRRGEPGSGLRGLPYRPVGWGCYPW